MYKIIKKQKLKDSIIKMTIDAKDVAQKALEGQFIILKLDKNAERIPLTISDYDRKKGSIDIIFQIVGATTHKLDKLKEGEYIEDLVGPLGNPTNTQGIKKAVVIGGGLGCAIALPIVRKLHRQKATVDSIIGFRNKELVILEKEFEEISNTVYKMSDDGSFGEKGLVTDALEKLLKNGAKYDIAIVIGPLIMMKFVSKLTRKYNLKTVVSMNSIMIDGTGMCGGCRLSVGGQTKFACIDGPDFDGHLVDFDQTISRNNIYKELEKKAYDKQCNLFKNLKGE